MFFLKKSFRKIYLCRYFKDRMTRSWFLMIVNKILLLFRLDQKQAQYLFHNIIFSMQQIINELQKVDDYKKQLRETCKRNRINIKTILGLTTKKMSQYYDRTLKQYASNPEKGKTRWYQNELRLFYWIAIIKSLLLAKNIKQFESQHWQPIQVFFPQKPIGMFQFEVTKLITTNASESYRSWMQEECDLLTNIMKEGNMGNRWKDVSRLFYEKSAGRLYRCSKQCRQQWLNHLDSSKIQGEWTSDEDLKILQAVIQHGHRWAMICRDLLPQRTEHMVKNRFSSIISKHFTYKQLRIYNERKIIRKVISRIKSTKNSVNSSSKNEQSVMREASEPSFDQTQLNVFQNQNEVDDSNRQQECMERSNQEEIGVKAIQQLSDECPFPDFYNKFSYMNPSSCIRCTTANNSGNAPLCTKFLFGWKPILQLCPLFLYERVLICQKNN